MDLLIHARKAEMAQITEVTVNMEFCCHRLSLIMGELPKRLKNGQQEKGETVRILDSLPLDN